VRSCRALAAGLSHVADGRHPGREREWGNTVRNGWVGIPAGETKYGTHKLAEGRGETVEIL
jgi:hypothetical protein